jgi:RES domain-containing protein
MEVFRITHIKWSISLSASGTPARWNSQNIFTIYSAASRSLACLEMAVHIDNTRLLTEYYRVMVISIPDELKMEKILVSDLPANWNHTSDKSYKICQGIGDLWSRTGNSAILEVPSAIIKNERNYLINPQHPDFIKIKIVDSEPFFFDPRIKKSISKK